MNCNLGEGNCLKCVNKKLRQQIKELQTKAKEANDVLNANAKHWSASIRKMRFKLKKMRYKLRKNKWKLKKMKCKLKIGNETKTTKTR